MNYGERFILRVNKQNENIDFQVFKYLMTRPENGNIIVENIGMYHYFKEIKIDENNKIVSFKEMIQECTDLIQKNEEQIKNIINLPNYHFMGRIIKLREEIEKSLINKNIYEKQYKRTHNKYDLQAIELIEKSIKQKQKGIRRLTKRVYKQMKEHPEIVYENLKECHYSKNYFDSQINFYKNIIENVKKYLEDN